MKAVYFLIAIAIITIYFMVELFSPFLKSMFVALLLTVATSSLTTYFENRLKTRVLATIVMTIGLTALFFLPILYCIFSFANFFNHVNQQELIASLNDLKLWLVALSKDFTFLQDFVTQITSKIDVGKTVQNVLSIGAYLGKNSAKFMMDMVFILIFFFFFTLYSTSIATFVKDLLPIKKDDSIVLFYESSNVMTVVLYSILITAIFEGFLFGFFLSLFHYDGLLLGVLYGFASLIPVVGGIIMWLPVVIYEASTNSMTNAVIIALYSIIVISIIADTFIKPIIIKYINQRVVKTPTRVNELLIFFSIVAGLSTIGFWGMIIGPAIVTFFISIMHLLKKYSDDFKENTP
ncbi:AI-2E family transporter [Malaciobacter pacificus]|uniref:Acid membrane antigen A n=1 Tax=Malaciobacter pacificus TaxID=1080223 RepID=A0A5C2HE75_9BACT|nr:AI-2E family transporter [Malaciobacter pacificus]QEP35094.1 acid membrane antigen A [Malaciobacter pacificus]GGD36752.1 AI-2E family transporter [Malaciobacter pacificus]